MSKRNRQINRRQFLKDAGATIAGAAAAALALDAPCPAANVTDAQEDLDLYDFLMPRVKFTEQGERGKGRGPDVWNVRPGGDANLLRELAAVIRCRVKPITGAGDWEPQYAAAGQLNGVVAFENLDEIVKYPFVFMTGENFYEFDEQQKYGLEQYVRRGGFVLMDDCVVASGGDFFYKSSCSLLQDVFGPTALRLIPHEHEVFHNVYDLGDTGLPAMQYVNRPFRPGLPYMHGQNHGARGVFIDGRLAVLLSSNDIHCGWCDSRGREFGRANYEKAIQMGINIIMYAISH